MNMTKMNEINRMFKQRINAMRNNGGISVVGVLTEGAVFNKIIVEELDKEVKNDGKVVKKCQLVCR